MTRNPPNRRAGFTLTEIMIALAMTALLLVGISKIFALTSATISTGQAAAKAMRSQRAIQQTLSNDFLGSGPDVGSATYDGGMLPLVNSVDVDYASPFLSISNFRVATYLNAAEMAASPFAPADQTTALTPTQFAARSLATRGLDFDKNGVQNPLSTLPPPSGPPSGGGETIPLYIYGDRNFRCDTVGFFTRGRFQSQTGTASSFQSQATSNEAYVWFGHLKVYNSEPTRLDYTNAYGGPGDWLTPNSGSGAAPTGVLPNRNNRFADQFRLGRMQSLLMPAIIPTGQVYPEGADDTTNTNAVDAQGVCVGNDPTNELRFIRRNWWSPTWKATSGSPPTRPSMGPVSTTATVRQWYSGQNRSVYSDDRIATATPAPISTVALTAASSRTDILGVDLKRYRQRALFTEQNDLEDPLTTAGQNYWWENLPLSWSGRYWVNPFPRTSQFLDAANTADNPTAANAINSKSLAQRQQIVADSCSQFIVEFAGDFVTQVNDTGGPNPVGSVLATVPDGVLDFAYVDNTKQTRWYGMPRDVDGDGVIAGYLNGGSRTSSDVIPVSDFASTITPAPAVPVRAGPSPGTGAIPSKPVAKGTYTDDEYANLIGPSTVYTFEKSLPPLPTSPPVNFATALAEPTTVADPSGTSYVCVWGPREFQHGTTLTAADGSTRTVYAVPQLIRVITDIRDPDGRMKEPLTQEYVFPVRVTGAVKPPANPG